MGKAISVETYRRRAARRLPGFVMDYLEGGAEDERGLELNRRAFERVKLVPRRLVDISARTTRVEVLGTCLDAPLVVAPTGLNGLLRPGGDLALARAAERAGVPFTLSTASNASLEEVADKAGGELWFQLYVIHPTLADKLVARALASGYRTLVITVDVQVNGKRERDIRNGFGLPFRYTPRLVTDAALHPAWSLALLRAGPPQMKNLAGTGAEDPAAQAALLSRQMDASFDWDRLKALRDRWPHRLIVKGVLDAGDVQACFDLGADAVVLSNHGGRQLDEAISPLDALGALPPSSRTVMLDSGVRRGSDVVKALALGARAVMVGRAVLYGLAADGEEGAFDVLRILKDEVALTLAHMGVTDPAELNPSFVKLP